MGEGTHANGLAAVAIGHFVAAEGDHSVALGNQARALGRKGAFVFGDASTTTPVHAQQDNHFVVRAQRFWLGNHSNATATAGRFLETSTGAYLSSGGTWTNSSDVNRKHFFLSVDSEQVLNKVAALPISTWSYRDDQATVRHMGPTAQDFHAAFGLGDSDKAIATVDVDGVALAAIQALDARTRALREENDELRARLARVEALLADRR